MISFAPDRLKGTGLIELETKYRQWDDSHREIEIDEVIMGNVIQAGQGQNPARQATIYAGMPKETSAFTVNEGLRLRDEGDCAGFPGNRYGRCGRHSGRRHGEHEPDSLRNAQLAGRRPHVQRGGGRPDGP